MSKHQTVLDCIDATLTKILLGAISKVNCDKLAQSLVDKRLSLVENLDKTHVKYEACVDNNNVVIKFGNLYTAMAYAYLESIDPNLEEYVSPYGDRIRVVDGDFHVTPMQQAEYINVKILI